MVDYQLLRLIPGECIECIYQYREICMCIYIYNMLYLYIYTYRYTNTDTHIYIFTVDGRHPGPVDKHINGLSRYSSILYCVSLFFPKLPTGAGFLPTKYRHTVDGRNPAPPWMVKTL